MLGVVVHFSGVQHALEVTTNACQAKVPTGSLILNRKTICLHAGQR